MSQRLDKWLCFARFVKHRAKAQELIEQGHVRVNKLRVTKCAHVVKADDILTIALHGRVRVVRIMGEAQRRGPASDARLLYQDLTAGEKQDASGLALC